MAMTLAQIKPSRILQLQHKTWRQLGEMVKKWIWADMRKGYVQEYTTGGSYQYSRDYAKYKANNFRRFTDGKRLKNFIGRAITSNRTSSVNMLATGDTIKGLKVIRTSKDKVTLSYDTKDEKKIIGNEALGRSIRTLNDENQEKAIKYLEKQFDKNIKDWYRDPVRIKL